MTSAEEKAVADIIGKAVDNLGYGSPEPIYAGPSNSDGGSVGFVLSDPSDTNVGFGTGGYVPAVGTFHCGIISKSWTQLTPDTLVSIMTCNRTCVEVDEVDTRGLSLYIDYSTTDGGAHPGFLASTKQIETEEDLLLRQASAILPAPASYATR